MTEETEQRKRKAPAKGPGLQFDAGKVFTPAEAKADDFKLDLEAARYKARKGQAGNRTFGGPHAPGCGCLQCLFRARYGVSVVDTVGRRD